MCTQAYQNCIGLKFQLIISCTLHEEAAALVTSSIYTSACMPVNGDGIYSGYVVTPRAHARSGVKQSVLPVSQSVGCLSGEKN